MKCPVFKCKINILNNKEAEIIFENNTVVDKGQSIVFYDSDMVLGGGVVF